MLRLSNKLKEKKKKKRKQSKIDEAFNHGMQFEESKRILKHCIHVFDSSNSEQKENIKWLAKKSYEKGRELNRKYNFNENLYVHSELYEKFLGISKQSNANIIPFNKKTHY